MWRARRRATRVDAGLYPLPAIPPAAQGPVKDSQDRPKTSCELMLYRNELISIVSSRPGPTPIAEIGAPDISSSALT